ncbi:unnamed protein product [Caenorhabditis angaria]|uniref:UTP--glucose-1-phosphate uridylyltransferase n=1 Tax=Caenorhabditis angaria TaxID=860376 RepID=A0A9P1J499_9PELO|nr:unnamed protein product [Caenorhabditis angaria]
MSTLEHSELYVKLQDILNKNSKTDKDKNDGSIFTSLYHQFLDEDAHIDWNSWRHIPPEVQCNLSDIPVFDTSRRDVLDKVVVIKLNGGLGTTMGCNEAKSFIVLRDNLSFLDFSIEQHKHLNTKHNANIPMYLMNSFYTENMTIEKLKAKNIDDVLTFEQSKCPRILKDTLLPVENAEWGDDAWYPPGHGNIYDSLVNTGTLDRLLAQGKEVIFVSNIDNTGATLDLSIAQFMLDHDLDYVMECTEKTQNDIKGGTLIEINKQLMHLEMPQVPKDHLDDFCSTKVFKIFNTNNIWVNLKAIKRQMPGIKSEIIVNHKTVREENVIQLETSIGGSIKNFKKAYCMHVPRNRFRPVKRVEDLVIMSSNLFSLTDDFTLELNALEVPAIDLGSFYSKIQLKDERMSHVPLLKNAKSFKVIGDVAFGENVEIRGDVIIQNNGPNQVKIADGTIFENETKIF